MKTSVTVTVQCSRNGCQRSFDYKLPLDLVRASVESGGHVDLEWPGPQVVSDAMAPGWVYRDYSVYCPEHG